MLTVRTRLLVALVIIGLATAGAGGQEQAPAGGAPVRDDASVYINDWLLLGPIPFPFPAFNNEAENEMDAAALLSYEDMDLGKIDPASGHSVRLATGETIAWRAVQADTGVVTLTAPADIPAVARLAAYIEVPRWMKVEFEAAGSHPFEITVDGGSIVTCKKGGAAGAPGDVKKGTAKIEQGKHLILAKTIYVPADSAVAWRLDVSLRAGDGFDKKPDLSLEPERNLNIRDITDLTRIRDVDISPEGGLVAVTLREQRPPEGDAETRVEIRAVDTGEIRRTLRGLAGLSNIEWAPTGTRLSYTTRDKETGTVWMVDLETGTVEAVVEEVKDLGGYTWGPDGAFIVYSTTDKPKKDETGVKRLRSLSDRRRGGRNRSYLYLSSVPGGLTRRLTAGKHSTHLSDIHPAGDRLLMTRYYEHLDERPYGISELLLLHLDDQRTEFLFRGPWMRSASWSPDGDRILILAGPSTFGEVGKNVPEDVIPNDYDTQAYLFDPETKQAEAITREFDPAVRRAFWSKADGNIYFIVEERSFGRLYRYHPVAKRFDRIELPFDYLSDMDVALEKPAAVLSGMSADHAARLYRLDLKRGRAKLLADPAADEMKYIEIGEMENWNFTSSSGRTIEGRISFPPGFDPGGKYPCIVYYYGGTSPTSRTFGGRYPKNLWAALGYVVYVLQPSGATGFGQRFSAFHVNDWGKIVSEEIIEGVTKFLEAHEYVDTGRVGCIGASYGGFMTQLLVTKTDLFAAAVSHAGISSITSYWGEGYWGYGYSAVAAANSFPWNRPDIYIKQSPLYAADRVNTPLLLLHGAVDTNVPPGESEQMYTALKLLGKEVEYIKYAEQNHFILNYQKRIAWSDAITAWFDRWLKDEPEWWDDLYPPLEEKPEAPGELEMQLIEREDRDPVLIGTLTRDDIVRHLPHWDAAYYDYTPDGEILAGLEAHFLGVDFTIVLGTWCSDSRREVPRLWRILEELQYPVGEISMLGVGSSRFTIEMGFPADVLEWSDRAKKFYGVERVATIIVSKKGKEIGRIVESPEESLERDLLGIVGEK